MEITKIKSLLNGKNQLTNWWRLKYKLKVWNTKFKKYIKAILQTNSSKRKREREDPNKFRNERKEITV